MNADGATPNTQSNESSKPTVIQSTPKTPPELELAQLRASNAELQRCKADAEKDRELFRDLYNKASAHASEVTKENNTLSERVSLAEGQVKDGLAMVRSTYTARVRALEDELIRVRGLNEVLTARDVKMQGDDIRRRAGEEADLRTENQRLRAQLAELRLDYHRMERLVEQLGTRELEEVEAEEPKVQSVVQAVPTSISPPVVIAT
ncbi:hypothetical protein EIP86_005759 [Pleurotus ostreatoroseus]|nr:hypothetical protein EIP86_005759 [Pleurotus ostreatoroseus]